MKKSRNQQARDAGIAPHVIKNRIRSGWDLERALTTPVKQQRKHRKKGTNLYREYLTWKNMHGRCYNPKDTNYKNYGARGITVCSTWNTFAVFLKDMGKKPSPIHSIDRKNGKLGYSKENCRWATRLEQANNKSSNVMIEYGGKKQSLAAWVRETGIRRATFRSRMRKSALIEEWFLPDKFTRRRKK